MTVTRKWILAVVVAAIAAGGGFWFAVGKQHADANASVVQIDSVADFIVTELEDTRGILKPVAGALGELNLINFWATWCVPCREEMPVFEQAYLRHQERGLVIIGLTIDEAERAEIFLQQLGISYPIFMVEEQGWDLLERFGNARGLLPYSVLIDRQGQVLEQKLGVVHAEELDSWAEKYLK